MINNKPNGAGNYAHGLYIPKNKEKVIKLNDKGGIYYRSSWEYKTLIWLDNLEHIVRWGCECIGIPYQLKKPDKSGILSISNHTYYPDFYYTIKNSDGSLRNILLEVKPLKQTKEPILKEGKRLTKKQLKNFEYDINEYNRNLSKWEAAINWCKNNNADFKLLTEELVNKMFI